MKKIPASVAEFLSGKRFAVAGVSRQPAQAANAIFQKLRASGYEVFPINPEATVVEGVKCYPDLASIPGGVDGMVVATHPTVAIEMVRQCAAEGVRHVWFHRSFGEGSVSSEAVEECRSKGLQYIVGGCPLMYCEPADFFHGCARWFLRWRGRVPG